MANDLYAIDEERSALSGDRRAENVRMWAIDAAERVHRGLGLGGVTATTFISFARQIENYVRTGCTGETP